MLIRKAGIPAIGFRVSHWLNRNPDALGCRNDIDFSSILKRCVFNDQNCESQLDASRQILYSKKLFGDYIRLVQIIVGYTGWHARNAVSVPQERTLLYVTRYPAFFDTYTQLCDTRTFIPAKVGLCMTTSRGRVLNNLGQELNLANCILAGLGQIDLCEFR